MRKIAIVGLAPSTHGLAPINSDWEIFGLPWDANYIFYQRLFEMHDLYLLRDERSGRPKDYEDRLKSIPDLYMQESYDDIPNAKRFPFEVISEITGDYWNSSIAYLMSMAIAEKPDVIGIFGVDMDTEKEEYAYQRPNMEYLIGLARGIGIKIYLPESCPLLEFNGKNIPLGSMHPVYPKRYGVL